VSKFFLKFRGVQTPKTPPTYGLACMGPKNHVLDGSPDLYRTRHFLPAPLARWTRPVLVLAAVYDRTQTLHAVAAAHRLRWTSAFTATRNDVIRPIAKLVIGHMFRLGDTISIVMGLVRV